MKDGLRCSGSIPYGYKREPGDKQTLIVDEPAAEVVRKIFRLVCQGVTTTGIAEILAKEKVLIPSAYLEQSEHGQSRNHSYHDPYRWNCTAVAYILEKQEYMGHTVLGKTICENFKTKKRRKATPDELIIFENTHEAIVDEETWHLAQKLRRKTKRTLANGTYSLPPLVWTALLFGLWKTPVLCKPTFTAQSRRKNLRCRQQLPLSYLQIHVRRVYDALYQGIHSGQSG